MRVRPVQLFTVVIVVAIIGAANAHADVEATVTPVPFPTDGVVLKKGVLASVSCGDSDSCVAVGNYDSDADTLSYPIVMRANGTQISSTKASNASGLGDSIGYGYSSGIRDIDCLKDGSAVCWAIGGSNRDATGSYGTQAFLIRVTASNWDTTYVTHSTGLSSSVLKSISCWSSTSCGVGGWISTSTRSRAAAGISSGLNVTPEVLPLPGGINATSKLLDISCVTGPKCVAIGVFYSGAEVKYFLSTFDGTTWSTEGLQLPSDVLPLDVTYDSKYDAKVSCTELNGCLIVGQYRGQYGYFYPFYAVTIGISSTVTTQRLAEGDTRSLSNSSFYLPNTIQCFGGVSLNCLMSGTWGSFSTSSFFMKKFDGAHFTDVAISSTSRTPEFNSFDCLSMTLCRGLQSSNNSAYIAKFSQLDLAAPTPTTTTVAPTTTTVAPTTTTVSPTTTTVSPTTTIVQSPAGVYSLRANQSVAHKSLAGSVNLVVQSGSRITITIASKYAKTCKIVGSTVRGLREGSCKITVKITPKKGPSTSRIVTLRVSK